MSRTRTILIWGALTAVLAVPLGAALASPLLAWRDPTYIIAGFAGVIALGLLLLQPLLIAGTLPGLTRPGTRRAHLWIGGALIAAVVVHVVGLWLTSPPDVIDALLFASPTPFSAWGVIAMWALFGVALLVAFRRWWHLRPRTWRLVHTVLAGVVVSGTVLHALLIDGTMETVTKAILCALVVVAVLKAVADLRGWTPRVHRR